MSKTGVALAVVALAGVSWWGATAYTGRSYAQGYDAQVAELQKKLPFLKISEVQKQSTLTGATYSGKLQVGCALPGSKEPLTIAFQDEVKYGPFPGFKGFGAAQVDSTLTIQGPQPLKIEGIKSSYGYGGGFETTWRLPAGTHAVNAQGQQTQLSWADGDIAVSGRRDGTLARFRASLPEFSMKVAGGPEVKGAGEFLFKGLVMEGETTGSNVWMRPGTQSFVLERMEAKGTDPTGRPQGMVMDKLAFKGSATLDAKNLMDMQASYTIAGMEVPAGEGPAVKLANMDMQVTMKRLEASGMEQAVQKMMATLTQDCGAQQDPQAQRLAIMKAVEGLGSSAKAMLMHDPSYSIDKFAIDFAGKRGEMSAQVAIQGLKQADLDGPPQALMPKLMQLVSATAKGRLPMEWMSAAAAAKGLPQEQAQEQAKLMADSFVQRGMATLEGENLVSSFSFAKGVAQINGKPVWQAPPQMPQQAPQQQ